MLPWMNSIALCVANSYSYSIALCVANSYSSIQKESALLDKNRSVSSDISIHTSPRDKLNLQSECLIELHRPSLVLFQVEGVDPFSTTNNFLSSHVPVFDL